MFDSDHLHRFTLGDKGIQIEVLTSFVTNLPTYMNALSNSDPRNWGPSAHKIKGAARAIGAWDLAECAEKAERKNPHDINQNSDERLIMLGKCWKICLQTCWSINDYISRLDEK